MTWVGDTLFARLLRLLARQVCRHPQWFVYPQLLLFVVSVVYTAFHWKLDMDRDNLVAGPTHQVYMNFRKEFPGEDELAVVVQSDDLERNRQFVERLAAKLEPETNLFTDVFYKGDLASLGRKALLFAPVDDLQEMKQKLTEYRPFIEQFTQATNLDSFFGLINKQFRTAKQEDNAQNNALISAIPALQRIVDQASESLTLPGTPVSPGVTALFGQGEEAEERMYITFAQGKIYLVTARPRSPDVVSDAVERMRVLVHETEMEVPGLNVGLTGEPVLDYDEMQQSTRDSIMASIVSLVICSLIFIYAYRETGRPLKAVACLIVGLGYTMAFTFLVVGHLNILTITFAPILIGLAIDFGIHLITRYEEEMRHGSIPVQAVDRAMVFTGQGIITGALTTAMAFLAMGITRFKGIQEMGIISGGGLALCLIPMMTLLPILLMKGRQNAIDTGQGIQEEKRARIENFWLQRPVLVLVVTIILCGAAASQFKKVYFDYNLLHMQSKGLPAVVYEKKLLYSAGQSVLSAAVVADSLQEAREIEEKVKKLPTVASVDGDDRGDPIFALLTGNQTAKLKLVNEIKNQVSDLHFAGTDTDRLHIQETDPQGGVENPAALEADEEQVHLHQLSETLYSTMGYLGQAASVVEKERPELANQLLSLRTAISDFRVKMLSEAPGIHRRLGKYQQALFDDIRQTFETIQNQDTSSPLRPVDLPPALHNQFIGRTGKYKVEVFPKDDIWEHTNQERFISELRKGLGPEGNNVTGTPVQLYEYTTLLKNSYQQAALYALIAIAIMVFLHFWSIPCVILSLLPVAIGSIWTLGLMGALGIPFNPADIMTLPLVIGIGVTNGIHILNRVAEEQKPGILAKSTGKAVLVSALTALTGFGSLTLAKHQGIQSLGLVMAMGIAACMIAALTFLPAALNILSQYGWAVAKKRPSSDNARSPLGLEEPR
jgi:hopanoid biosynthesis associated RND transporter like protein HpnN